MKIIENLAEFSFVFIFANLVIMCICLHMKAHYFFELTHNSSIFKTNCTKKDIIEEAGIVGYGFVRLAIFIESYFFKRDITISKFLKNINEKNKEILKKINKINQEKINEDENSEISKALKFFNLHKNYTQDELKSSYRKLCKEWHPDRGGDSDSFIKITEWFEYFNKKFA